MSEFSTAQFTYDEAHPRNLFEVAVDLGSLPTYPTMGLRHAQGGEKTFEIEPMSDAARSRFEPFGWNKKVNIISRKARKGELLRTPGMKYMATTMENGLYRIDLIQKAQKDKAFQAVLKNWCRSDILFFANTFAFTFDPRGTAARKIPFVSYPFQDEALTWMVGLIKNKQTGVVEKSREVGASWMFVIVGAWLILFHELMVEYWMSLTEDLVDNRELSSLLGKLRYVLNNVPTWMRGGWKEYDQGYDLKMKVKIPETESVVQGQLTRGTAGVSGRATRVVVDEAAIIEDFQRVAASISNISDSKLFVSTPRGMGNHFGVMANDPNTNKKTFHWSRHPLKNEEWAKSERSSPEYTDTTWAQEQEIDYAASAAGRVFLSFKPYSSGEYDWKHVQTGSYFEYDPMYEVYVGMDFGMGDPTSAVFAQIKPPPLNFEGETDLCLVFFHELENVGMGVDWWGEYLNKLKADRRFFYKELVGDNRSGNQRNAKGMTWFKYFKEHGLEFRGRYSGEAPTIIKMQRLLERPGRMAINAQRCPHLIKAYQNWAYSTDRDGNAISDAKPKHDQWSHAMKAALYLVDYLFDDDLKKRSAMAHLGKKFSGYAPLLSSGL